MTVYFMDGSSMEVHPKCFEFRANSVSNWLRVVYGDGSEEMFHDVGAIAWAEIPKPYEEANP